MPRPDVSDARRAQIIRAAIAVYQRDGFTNARMADIAQEADLSVGGVYWYYKGKQELVTDVMHHIFTTDLERMRAALDDERPLLERISEQIDSFIAVYRESSELRRLVQDMYAQALIDEERRAILAEYMQAFRTVMAAMTRQGIEQGLMRPDLDPDALATALFGMFDGILMQHSIDPDAVDWELSFRAGSAALIGGLMRHP
ncbi:MAG: TetR/AcrR family transcriptional regulator [Anaerolineae bacterium]